MRLLTSMFGSANERLLKKFMQSVEAIKACEEDIAKLSDSELQAQTAQFKTQLENGAKLDDILPSAFATVKVSSKRVLGLAHFDVQLLGGVALHKGYIAEMKTGEGKTLVATLAVYLNALSGEGVHVVTVNDYLAGRDAEWMGALYRFLGLSVGVIAPNADDAARQQAYGCDITYGTNNEFGFDYLRDNLKIHPSQLVQRGFHLAVIDEVDSILIDEARTPLVISGPADTASENYVKVNKLIPHLQAEDYDLDEKSRSVSLTESGGEHIEKLLQEKTNLLTGGQLYDIHNIGLLHHVEQALRAHRLFMRDKDYMVQDGNVLIIDEFTGRAMSGRRYSDGLHQAIEAKEGLAVQTENQTLASVTFQNYFRMYPRLCGMTGTATTEAEEFEAIYHLPVVSIPPNRSMIRRDHEDEIYRTERERDLAFLRQIEVCVEKRQPVLVGSASIERSEVLSRLLSDAKIAHQVLNARQNAAEAEIIAKAGEPGAITIATNMAGRGTDIQLGGNLAMRLRVALEGIDDLERRETIRREVEASVAADREVALAAGGLYVLGTERHESRRIDNQLRGRSGRQGDVGESKFHVSLEDDLMRIFGTETMDKILLKLGLADGEAISHPWISRALEKAQQKVEQRNFEIRKQLLKFDDVMNDQRMVIFEQRKELMAIADISETVREMRLQTIDRLVGACLSARAMRDEWQWRHLGDESRRLLNVDLPISAWEVEEGIDADDVKDRIVSLSDSLMAAKSERFGEVVMRQAEKSLTLQILDHSWKEHLLQLDHLRQGIGLRAYGQRDPLNEYKQESFSLFEDLLNRLNESTTQLLSYVELQSDFAGSERDYRLGGAASQPSPPAGSESRVLPAHTQAGKTRRNDPCPCGSGKKYKHCHGKI